VPEGKTTGELEDYKLLDAEVAVQLEAVTETTHDKHDDMPTNQPSSNDDNTGVI
jgi:hypothetical protein